MFANQWYDKTTAVATSAYSNLQAVNLITNPWSNYPYTWVLLSNTCLLHVISHSALQEAPTAVQALAADTP